MLSRVYFDFDKKNKVTKSVGECVICYIFLKACVMCKNVFLQDQSIGRLVGVRLKKVKVEVTKCF